MSARLLVIGLGNELCTDDALGLRAVQALAARKLPLGVTLHIEAPGGVLQTLPEGEEQTLYELLGELRESCRLLIVDAVLAGRPPGSMIRVDEPFRGPGQSRPVARFSHDSELQDVLAALQLAGGPEHQCVLLGVEPASLELGWELSAEAAAALPGLVDALEREILGFLR